MVYIHKYICSLKLNIFLDYSINSINTYDKYKMITFLYEVTVSIVREDVQNYFYYDFMLYLNLLFFQLSVKLTEK